MKNYPEYPDNFDVVIKDLAVECGVEDWAFAKNVVSLCAQLRNCGICHPKLVRVSLLRFLDEFLPQPKKGK